MPAAAKPPRDPAVAARGIEDAGPRRQVEHAAGSPRCRCRSGRRRSTPRRSTGSRRRTSPPVRRACAIFAAGRVACMPAPEDLSFDAATAVRATGRPGVSRPTCTRSGRWATSRTVATSWPSSAAPRRTTGREDGGRTLGDRLVGHHLPAAARARPGDHRDHAAAAGPHGGPGPRRPAPERHRRRRGHERPRRAARHARRRGTTPPHRSARPEPERLPAGACPACPAARRSASWR